MTNKYPRRKKSVVAVALVLAQGVGPAVNAQTAQTAITPGSVQDIMRDTPTLRRTAPPQVVVPSQVVPADHDPRAKRFRVNAFKMVGNTVFTQQELKRVVERYVDYQLNLYDLNHAADAITEFYHDHGYTLARAFIPMQMVRNNVVEIRIIEGRFGKVSFSGNKRFSNNFLTARIPSLAPDNLVTTDKLERDLLLLNDIPGLSAKAVMQPGSDVGTSDAEINVQEKLIDGAVSVNNYGRSETGRNRVETSLNLNSPFGLGDQLGLSGSVSNHSLVKYWRIGYSVPLNTVGTRLAVGTSNVGYGVNNAAIEALGVTGSVRTNNVTITHPLQRSRNDNQSVSLEWRRERMQQNALDTTVVDDTINVYALAYQINHIHRDAAVTNASINYATNFKSNNDTPSGMFGRLEMTADHTAPFYGAWDLYLKADVVWSKERLPDTEKFSVGGPGSVRAFRPAEVRGDSGLLTTVEFRHPFTVMQKMGIGRIGVDWGQAVYKAPGYNDSRDNLRDVDVGLTFFPAKNVAASIDVARTIGEVRDGLNDGRNTRVWMNLSASF